jgi:ribonucleotide reductase beta subunit family protein with ferritin-like domain
MGITIYSKDGCDYCEEAAILCEEHKLPYNKLRISKEELDIKCQKKVHSYPQIFLDDELIGDFFQFEDWLETETYEPMTAKSLDRFSLIPVKYENLFSMYKKAQHSNWTAEEIDFSLDKWDDLTHNEQHFIRMVLAFFSSSDGIVFENLSVNFASEITIPEARAFFAFQEHNEWVHSETYGKLISVYIKDEDEKDRLFSAIETIPCIQKKAKWAMSWLSRDRPLGERLFAFACVEGIFFSGSFCAIFWLKKRGLLPGLTFSNELISRDEGLHLEFGCELIRMLRKPPSRAVVNTIIQEAVAIEKEFVCESLPVSLIGMNAEHMSTYIEYVADRLLKSLGHPALWNSKNPFTFMENQSIEGKTNFFERRVSEYGKPEQSDIAFDESF